MEWCFQQYFSYLFIVAVSFIGGGNWGKPPTCRKSEAGNRRRTDNTNDKTKKRTKRQKRSTLLLVSLDCQLLIPLRFSLTFNIYKTLYTENKWSWSSKANPTRKRGELMYSGRVGSNLFYTVYSMALFILTFIPGIYQIFQLT